MCSDVTSCVMCDERVPVEQGALADATLVSTRCSSPRAPTSSRGSTSGGARRWRWWWRCATAVAGCRSSLCARIWAAPAPRFDADLGSSRLISGHLAESRLHLHRAVDADRAGARTPVSAACELVQTQNVQHLTPQAHAAVSAACELAARHGGCGVVAGCDLNSIPGSGVHRLLTSGSLPHSHPHMAAVAAHSAALPLGTAPLHRRTAVNRPSSRSTSLSRRSALRLPPTLPAAAREPSRCPAPSPPPTPPCSGTSLSSQTSPARSVAGSPARAEPSRADSPPRRAPSGPPCQFVGTLDYVLCSSHFAPARVLQLPSEDTVRLGRFLPSERLATPPPRAAPVQRASLHACCREQERFPSDHLPLLAHLNFAQGAPAGAASAADVASPRSATAAMLGERRDALRRQQSLQP